MIKKKNSVLNSTTAASPKILSCSHFFTILSEQWINNKDYRNVKAIVNELDTATMLLNELLKLVCSNFCGLKINPDDLNCYRKNVGH